jgi:hypothetical protein
LVLFAIERMPGRLDFGRIRVDPGANRAEIAPTRSLLCCTEAEQHLFDVHQGRPNLLLYLSVTSEGILDGILHQPGLHRVEMDVQDQAIEITLIFNEFRFVSALPDAAGSAETPVESAAESVLNPVHPAPKGDRRASDDKVEVVGHQTPSENSPAITLLDVANDLDKLNRLVGISENRLAARYPVVHVVQTTLDNYPRPARHRQIPQLPKAWHCYNA